MSFLLLPHLRVKDANIHHASFLLGGAPILPSFFLGHALGRAINCECGGVVVVHHYMQGKGEWFKGVFSPQQRRAAAFTFGKNRDRDYSSKNKHALSLQPIAVADLEVSLLFECEGVRSFEAVEDFLRVGRLAGGTFTSFGKPKLFDEITEAQRSISSGFLVLDRRDLLEPSGDKHQGQLFVEALGTVKENREWLSASCVGYATISPIAPRAGVREGYQHAFVEPLVGLIEYRSVRRYSGELADAMWRPEWLAGGVFRVRAGIPGVVAPLVEGAECDPA